MFVQSRDARVSQSATVASKDTALPFGGTRRRRGPLFAPASLEVELLPIVEDDCSPMSSKHDTHTYLTIGANIDDAPSCKNSIAPRRPAHCVSSMINAACLPHELEAWYDIEQQDSIYSDWPRGRVAIWSELIAPFADEPRYPIAIDDQRHVVRRVAGDRPGVSRRLRSMYRLRAAGRTQYGSSKGDSEEHGQLILRDRGCWELVVDHADGVDPGRWPETPAIGACAAGIRVEPGAVTFHVPIKRRTRRLHAARRQPACRAYSIARAVMRKRRLSSCT